MKGAHLLFWESFLYTSNIGCFARNTKRQSPSCFSKSKIFFIAFLKLDAGYTAGVMNADVGSITLYHFRNDLIDILTKLRIYTEEDCEVYFLDG